MVLAIYAVILSGAPALASVSAKDDVKKGNLLYNNKRYAEAGKLYEEAAALDPSSGIASFNLGLAKYRANDYSAAIEKFNNAIGSGKPTLIPAADYNIGNAQYRMGSAAEKTDIKKAKDFYETALKFYKRAIDLNPDDRDAKFN